VGGYSAFFAWVKTDDVHILELLVSVFGRCTYVLMQLIDPL
jgi:hypothetical protein